MLTENNVLFTKPCFRAWWEGPGVTQTRVRVLTQALVDLWFLKHSPGVPEA